LPREGCQSTQESLECGGPYISLSLIKTIKMLPSEVVLHCPKEKDVTQSQIRTIERIVHSVESEITQTNLDPLCIVNRRIVKMEHDSSSLWLSSFRITAVRHRPKHTICEEHAMCCLPFQPNRHIMIAGSIEEDQEHRVVSRM
jgi:hypothetical protein